MMKRSIVGWSVVAPEYGRTCAPGDVVDLSERLPRGGTLADVVRLEWFEDVTPATVPARRREPAKATPAAPAEE
jgi:hypothetical protein